MHTNRAGTWRASLPSPPSGSPSGGSPGLWLCSTRLGPPSQGGPSGSSVRRPEEDHRNLVEMVYPGSIASGDLGLLLFGTVLQNLLNDLPAPGEGGLDMGII